MTNNPIDTTNIRNKLVNIAWKLIDFDKLGPYTEHVRKSMVEAQADELEAYTLSRIVSELQEIHTFREGDIVTAQTVADRVASRISELNAKKEKL